MSSARTDRIAISFASSASTARASQASQVKQLGDRWRRHVLDQESDSDSNEDNESHGQKITGFSGDGVEIDSAEKCIPKSDDKRYVIARQPNKDWRSELRGRRGRKRARPADEDSSPSRESTERTETHSVDQLRWGLTTTEKSEPEANGTHSSGNELRPENVDPEVQTGSAEQSIDVVALDALLGKRGEKDKVIELATAEDDAYQRDVKTAGEDSTLTDYETMPVEEFGAALLRGMGWDGEMRGPKQKTIKRRQNRLGLGAKELKDAEELGAWDQRGPRKRRPHVNEYRREEDRRNQNKRRGDSYKSERDREQEAIRGDRHHRFDQDRRRGHDLDRDRGRDSEGNRYRSR